MVKMTYKSIFPITSDFYNIPASRKCIFVIKLIAIFVALASCFITMNDLHFSLFVLCRNLLFLKYNYTLKRIPTYTEKFLVRNSLQVCLFINKLISMKHYENTSHDRLVPTY